MVKMVLKRPCKYYMYVISASCCDAWFVQHSRTTIYLFFRDRMNLKWTCDLLVLQPSRTFAEIWWTLQASALILGLSPVTSCMTVIVSEIFYVWTKNGFLFKNSQTKVCNTLDWGSWSQRCETIRKFKRSSLAQEARLAFGLVIDYWYLLCASHCWGANCSNESCWRSWSRSGVQLVCRLGPLRMRLKFLQIIEEISSLSLPFVTIYTVHCQCSQNYLLAIRLLPDLV